MRLQWPQKVRPVVGRAAGSSSAPLATWKVCSEPSVTAASVLSSPGRSMEREYLVTCSARPVLE